jgi:hypothetical protein
MKNKKIFLFFSFSILIIVFGWIILKSSLEFYASQKAWNTIESAYSNNTHETIDEKVIAITTQIHHGFSETDPSKNLALRLRPFLTNHRLPPVFRLENGVIETILGKGLCDNAVRALQFTLKQENLPSSQWNMVTPHGGHAALIVSIDENRTAFVDPFFGLISLDKKSTLRSPDEIYEKVKSGHKIENIFTKISDRSSLKFYEEFANVSMAKQGERLVIASQIPEFQGEITLGEIDSSFIDVMRAGKSHNMSSYWHYVGHKYDRNWIRTLEAKKPTKVIFSLVEKPDSSILTSNITPVIEGKDLIWTLKKEEKLVFEDHKAELSLKRRNSYIDIDKITFLQYDDQVD